MPHYCRICGRNRPNEKFSGRGHRDHICKDCQRLPRDQREYVDRMDELYGFLEQSNISRKNIVRLEILAQHVNNDVRHLAMLILEVARVKPHKRRRWKFLAHNHFNLYVRLKELWGDDAPDEVPDFQLDLAPPIRMYPTVTFELLPRHGTGTSRHVHGTMLWRVVCLIAHKDPSIRVLLFSIAASRQSLFRRISSADY